MINLIMYFIVTTQWRISQVLLAVKLRTTDLILKISSGADQRQRHSLGGRGGLLSRIQRHRVHSQRGERPSLY